MVVASPVGLYLTLAGPGGMGGYPGSLMGVFAYIRQIMLDAEHYRLVKEDYAKNAGGKKRPSYDRALEGVLDSPRLLLPANTVVEIDRVLRFAAEFKSPTVVYGVHEAYRAADVLKRHGATALVNLRWPERARDADPDQVESLRNLETREKAPSGPAVLAKAGVRFAFYSGGIENPREILRAARKALDAGLPNEAAVRAFTLTTAEIYNVADRLGSLDPGKIANLVVTDGDIFQERTRVRFVLVDGVKIETSPETPLAGASEATQ
jgi:imidazolonepropionase-like amidohydrolase